MHKYDKIIIFSALEENQLLFRIINYGNKTDELKFLFTTGLLSPGVIFTVEKNKLMDDDVITDYSEISYHSDGSVLFKFPHYEIQAKKYNNPKEKDYRRRPLDSIEDWEPLVNYEIYNYRFTKIEENFAIEHSEKIFQLAPHPVFNSPRIGCIISLVNKDFKLPISDSSLELNTRITGITDKLDLWIVISPITKDGNYLIVEGFEAPVFSDNNSIEVIEKK